MATSEVGQLMVKCGNCWKVSGGCELSIVLCKITLMLCDGFSVGGWGLGMGIASAPCETNYMLRKLNERLTR